MKNTGIIRNMDELGRVVIPKEIRDRFDIQEKDPMEIYVDQNKIILKKHENSCSICGNKEKLKILKDKIICQECIDKIINNDILPFKNE